MGVPVLYAGSKYYPGIPPDKQYPAFSSAEVGNVNASTVAVTFSVNISASDYATGVTIKVNGSAATISSATRQANHAIVYYVLSAAVVNGDTVTWEYSGGSIVNEATGAAMQTTGAQSVINNIVSSPGDTLRADAVAYWSFDQAGDLTDLTGHGNDAARQLTQTGTAAGKVGNAVTFPNRGTLYPNNGFLRVSDGSQFNFGNTNFTLMGWVRLDGNLINDTFEVIAKRNGSTGNLEFDLFTTMPVSDQFFCWDFAGVGQNYSFVVSSYGPLVSSTWYFVKIWFRASDLTLGIKVNNITEDTAIAFEENVVEPGSLYIGGNNPDPFLGLYGAMDEWGIWHRLTTQAEDDYLYNSGAGRALFPAP